MVARANLHFSAIPLRSKADRVEDWWELVQLGFDLMAEAETLADLAKAADLYRDGLIIALLVLRPFRRRNFHGIIIGRHLLRAGDSWRFEFAADETKGRRAVEKSFPASLVVPMKRYLKLHRPKLLAAFMGPVSADRAEAPLRLWISNYGNPLSLSGFATHIGQHTRERFGWAMDPHSFRHCLATTLAKDNPEAVWLVMCILDHTDFAITDRYYIVAQRKAAQQSYAALLENLRKGLVGGRRSDHPALLALFNDIIGSRGGRQSQW
jgi:integrase/recombinase XerD